MPSACLPIPDQQPADHYGRSHAQRTASRGFPASRPDPPPSIATCTARRVPERQAEGQQRRIEQADGTTEPNGAPVPSVAALTRGLGAPHMGAQGRNAACARGWGPRGRRRSVVLPGAEARAFAFQAEERPCCIHVEAYVQPAEHQRAGPGTRTLTRSRSSSRRRQGQREAGGCQLPALRHRT